MKILKISWMLLMMACPLSKANERLSIEEYAVDENRKLITFLKEDIGDWSISGNQPLPLEVLQIRDLFKKHVRENLKGVYSEIPEKIILRSHTYKGVVRWYWSVMALRVARSDFEKAQQRPSYAFFPITLDGEILASLEDRKESE